MSPAVDLEQSDQKPRPVQEDMDACDLEESDCSIHARHRGASYHKRVIKTKDGRESPYLSGARPIIPPHGSDSIRVGERQPRERDLLP